VFEHSAVERWLPVVGYEGFYEVSDQGRVRSVDRLVPHDAAGNLRRRRGCILQPATDSRGRKRVHLRRDGVGTRLLVHHLVLTAFVGPRPPGLKGCHDDGNTATNWLSNLRWDTQSENMLDKGRHGTDPQRNKTQCPRRHLLTMPNLVRWLYRKGHRYCLACSRAQIERLRAKQRGKPFDFDIAADQYYAEIMGL
jgi:NUMOD4 motif-containing protein/HNH endonuclease